MLNNTSSDITNGTYSYLFQNLGPGVYSVRVIVYDLMNNSDSDSVTFVVYGVPGDDGSSGSGGSSITLDVDPTSNSSNNSYGVNISVNESVNWVIELIVNGNVVDQIQGNGSSVITLNYTYPASGNYTIQFNVTYTVNGDSVTITYGPYNVWIDLIPPTLNISWPRPGESYTEGIRTFEFYVEDDFAQVLTCSYLFTGPNTYNNTVQVQNGSTYSINLEFSRGSYELIISCTDGINNVSETILFSIRRSGGEEQIPPEDQQEQQPIIQEEHQQDSRDSASARSSSISTSDQEEQREILDIRDISEQLEQKEIVLDSTDIQPRIVEEVREPEPAHQIEQEDQPEATTTTTEDERIRGNLMYQILNIILPQQLPLLFTLSLLSLLAYLRVLKMRVIMLNDRTIITFRSITNRPVRNVSVRIFDQIYRSDENGQIIINIPTEDVVVQGFWIVLKDRTERI
ncbi:MAG: hypothetical protein QXD03_01435 [Candidatus Anstonellales archaeon]